MSGLGFLYKRPKGHLRALLDLLFSMWHCKACQENFDRMLLHMELMRPFDVFLPKHHIILHALAEANEKGNPWFYGSWLDESLNKLLKGCCRGASQLTFEETVLAKVSELLKEEPTSVRARKRPSDA
jgi:hypothetical protein